MAHKNPAEVHRQYPSEVHFQYTMEVNWHYAMEVNWHYAMEVNWHYKCLNASPSARRKHSKRTTRSHTLSPYSP